MNRDFSASMNDSLKGKDANILGKYSCFGYNTFGPFKLIGGTSKGHPDEDDIKKAKQYADRVAELFSGNSAQDLAVQYKLRRASIQLLFNRANGVVFDDAKEKEYWQNSFSYLFSAFYSFHYNYF